MGDKEATQLHALLSVPELNNVSDQTLKEEMWLVINHGVHSLSTYWFVYWKARSAVLSCWQWICHGNWNLNCWMTGLSEQTMVTEIYWNCKARIACSMLRLFQFQSKIFRLKVLFSLLCVYPDLFCNVFRICAMWGHLWYFQWSLLKKRVLPIFFRVLSRLAHLINEIREIISLWFPLFSPYLGNVLHFKKVSF